MRRTHRVAPVATDERVTQAGLIGVSEFVEETREDYNSPTTSTFVSKMPQCRQTIAALEEVRFCYLFIFCVYILVLICNVVY